MSDTIRKDKYGVKRKETLHKKKAPYTCRCEYCLGKQRSLDKIAEKEMQEEVIIIEKGEDIDFEIPEQEEIINKYNTQWYK